MVSEPDLDDSVVVEIVAWGLYLGWLCTLSWIALYFGFEPLHSIAGSFETPFQGTAAALATGVGFLLVANKGYRILKGRLTESEVAEDPVPEVAEDSGETSLPSAPASDKPSLPSASGNPKKKKRRKPSKRKSRR
jgi:hypothetical protein